MRHQIVGSLSEDVERTERHQNVISVLERLARGIDPITGEALPEGSPYQRIEVTRSLFYAVRVLEHLDTADEAIEQTIDPAREFGVGWLMPTGERQALNRASGLPRRAYAPWSEEEEQDLLLLRGQGLSMRQCAQRLDRQQSAIDSRVKRIFG